MSTKKQLAKYLSNGSLWEELKWKFVFYQLQTKATLGLNVTLMFDRKSIDVQLDGE